MHMFDFLRLVVTVNCPTLLHLSIQETFPAPDARHLYRLEFSPIIVMACANVIFNVSCSSFSRFSQEELSCQSPFLPSGKAPAPEDRQSILDLAVHLQAVLSSHANGKHSIFDCRECGQPVNAAHVQHHLDSLKVCAGQQCSAGAAIKSGVETVGWRVEG